MRLPPSTILAACLAFLPTIAHSSGGGLGYFADANVRVDTIAVERTAKIGGGYTVKAIYAYPKGTAFEGHFVGVFLIRDGLLDEVLDMVPSERGLDFFPSIRAANQSRVVISFMSNYGELDKRKYVLDLRKRHKLVKIVRLPTRSAFDD